MNYEVCYCHADKHRSLLQPDTHFGCVQPGMPEVPKIKSLHILVISLEKHGLGGWGGEVDFLPASKHESFLQVDSITKFPK